MSLTVRESDGSGVISEVTLRELFGDLGPESLSILETEGERVVAPAGTSLMRQGEPGDCLWLVVSGKVEVYLERDDGIEQSVGEAGPGETLGEMALLSSEPRSASARTRTDAELVRLSRAGFEHVLHEHPRTAAVFARIVVDRLNERLRARALVTEVRRMPLVTEAECDEVVQTDNLVLRNLRITQMYHRLSLELTLLTGPQDTNWCTFACNASKTAGYSIRREELPLYEVLEIVRPRLARRFDRLAERMGQTAVGARVDAALAAVSETISAGNLKVFAELGPIFAAMTRTFHSDPHPDLAKLDRFLDTLEPGPTEDGGQSTLAEALALYYEAMFTHDVKKRSELILLANLKVGYHEQIRLQPHIAAAMDAPMQVGLDGLFSERFDRRIGRFLPATAVDKVHQGLDHEEEVVVRWVTAAWRRRLTRNLMTLRLPYGTVRLGADVPKLPDREMYPDVLQTLENPDLVDFARRWDRCEVTSARSRAADWACLEDRMSFILELMRSRQKSLELFAQPFLEEQRTAIAAGAVPTGRL